MSRYPAVRSTAQGVEVAEAFVGYSAGGSAW